jgi:lactoylglutathione lyase
MKSTLRILMAGLMAGLWLIVPFASGADPNPATAPAEPAVAPVGMTVRFELFVKDTHVAADFYTRILGFECDTDAGPYIQARSGAVRIGICDQSTLPGDHHFSPAALQGRKGIGTEIVLEVENLDAFYERVVKSGYGIREELAKRPWGLRDFRLVDPDGYYLRITERR